MEMLQSKLGKVVFARLSEDEDLLETITHAAEKSHITAGFFILVGTLKKANLGFYRKGKYETIKIDGPVEIVSCMGNISLKEDKPFAHAHISVSNEKGEVTGGHVMSGCTIAATGELVLIEAADARLLRKLDKKTQLFLWSMEK
ncbi:DNA-binding protein [Candidatus Micrarchaeota archaeon]|nr:DNA-binding protein [Candidatus Micrarchaeota archaeon]